MEARLWWQILFGVVVWCANAGTERRFCFWLHSKKKVLEHQIWSTKLVFQSDKSCTMFSFCGRIYRHELVDGEVREAIGMVSKPTDVVCLVL